MNYCISLTCFFLTFIVTFASGDDSIVSIPTPLDGKIFAKHKSKVCDSFPPSKKEKSPFYDLISEEELLDLAILNVAYGLTTDSIGHLPPSIIKSYKRRALDLIAFITKESCEDIVPGGYLNAAKNLFLHYLSRKDESSKNVNDTLYVKQTWTELLTLLEQCSNNMIQIPIMQECGWASAIDMDGEAVPIPISEEKLDQEKSLNMDYVDEIIDAVWWMFSTAYARCYSMYYPREEWVMKFFDMFMMDVLEPFLGRWRDPGPMASKFPIVFGPFDFSQAKKNLRACNAAAYTFEGIPERQLVRPLLTTLDDGTSTANFKTGIRTTDK